MNRSQALNLIQSGLARIARFEPESAMFVLDDDVDYSSGEDVSVSRSDLLHLATDEDWRALLQGSHAWLHANLIEAADGTQVVALRLGPPAAGPRHEVGGHELNVNASAERRPLRLTD
jgi:hypothetical protein